jgi:spermidine synthase
MSVYFEPYNVALKLSELNTIARSCSKKQKLILYQHPSLGKVLVIDEEIQHVEAWQPLYHEQIVHLPASFIPIMQDVLIIGGGSLFAAKEVLKYKSVKNVYLVDHDFQVIKLMEKFYHHSKEVLQDTRFTYVESEGIAWIKKDKKNMI